METSNQRTVYSFDNETESLKCKGDATYNVSNNTIYISAEAMTKEEQILGTFYYTEDIDGRVNKSIDNVNKTHIADVEELMMKSVSEFKSLLNQEA